MDVISYPRWTLLSELFSVSELQDSMEQSRCLLIAVQSEIKSVQDEILAVQKSMLQDESQSVRIRKWVREHMSMG